MAEKLNRRDFLRFSALAAAGITVAACAKTAEPTPPSEAGATATTKPAEEKPAATPVPAGPSAKQAPMLQDKVAAGELPPLEERTSEDPMMVEPFENIGRHGGDMGLGTLGVADGAIFTRFSEYENLVRWDVPWTKVIPGVVNSWEIQDGGKSFVFPLRKGMKWSDGEPFTADDIMFWYEQASNTELNPVFSATWSVAGEPCVVTKTDDYTVRFSFVEPYGLFLRRLACPGGELFAPKHFRKQFFPAYADKAELEKKTKEAGVDSWYEGYGEWVNPRLNPEAPLVYAWVYTSVLGDSPMFICDRNAYYWKLDPEGNQLPYCDRQAFSVTGDTEAIVMMAVAGEISYQQRHIATPANKALFMENMEAADIRFVEASSPAAIGWVTSLNLCHKDPVVREIFQNKSFRIALSHAINREEMIDVVFLGQGIPWQPSPLPESVLYNEELSTQYLEYDPAKANELLDEILPDKDAEGYRLRPDGQVLTIAQEVCTQHTNWIDGLEMIKNYWADVGIKMAIKVEDRSLFYERKAANEHDAGNWGGNGGVMDVILGPRWYFPETNESIYAVPWAQWWQTGGKEGMEPIEPARKQQELYDTLLTTPDEEGQNEIMKQILQISQEQFWCIGLLRDMPGYAVCKNKFRNVPSPFWSSWLYPNPGPMNPCTFYWEE